MYTKKQRIAAMIGVIALVLLTIALLLAAVFDGIGRLFYGLLFAEIALPILLWIYIWLFGKLTGKATIADFGKNVTREGADGEEDNTSVIISKRPSGKSE